MSNPDQLICDDQNIDKIWELKHIESSIKRMSKLGEVGIRARQAGLYEMIPDAHLIIGSTPVEGFYVIAVFLGHGFMQGSERGKLMGKIITQGIAQTVDISSLNMSRFNQMELNQENTALYK